ncbi:type I polyketide synthase [Nostoc sp. DedQUE09]|uniref:type I polyketide synthase n=1 Tax=Nostoc sp. DedQUE09 TaxID=3075394 RepID=UPI002AD3644E|nr:SDR family NAD(P)-dependent oxidoreductase [Nostoc sp. DedQUE09]MDZ7950798.1 SDR family NAD(P)-dependent oxidoreductase [Nostoc sp. DedQUE09]
MMNQEEMDLTGIAIIGMAGRFPKAKDIETFWHNLKNGIESISVFSSEEMEENIDPAIVKNPQFVKAGYVLEDVDLFDAQFFRMTPKEAEIIDPQQRIFLECAWEALENAGYTPENYQRAIGVYAGSGINTYSLLNLGSQWKLGKPSEFVEVLIGNDKDYLATRVSYKLNLNGPSICVQTACSTSLVAVNLACQSLLDYQCDMALAGGVSIKVPQKLGYLYQEGGAVSPDGHCRAFDAKAQGTVGGNGLGIVVLKRLEDALADGDCIHAVIKGSAINNDGSSKVGYTAPSVDGQAKAIAEALSVAGIEPETISYVEAHGTGTPLGDPIEIAALSKVFPTNANQKPYCAIGSVKTNIGHLDAAAGIAGLIKTVLSLKHKLLPPSLHFQKPNPQIDFANSPFYVNTSLSEWKANGTPRRAGISSFGFGGTNTHIVLEEAPSLREQGSRGAGEQGRKSQLLLLSAKTDSALETATKNLAQHLRQHPDINLADVAYTLQVGRSVFNYRRMLVCQNVEYAVNALENLNLQQSHHLQKPSERPIVFMLPGQGTQYVNMARELYETEPIFREEIDRCCQLLQPHLNLDLRQVLYPNESNMDKATQQLKQTAIAQPALFVIEYALAKLWMSWGVQPQAAIGHSIGEYVAACLAGVFCLEDALALVAARGKMMQQLPPGLMLSVSLSAAEVQPFLKEGISLAAINAPSRCVVSGAVEAIAQLEDELATRSLEFSRLHTSHAFHSSMMDFILDPFTELVKKVKLNPPQIPFLSNLTGTWILATEAASPSYWAKHLRCTVQFSSGIQELLKDPKQILLELGPGRTLSSLTKQHFKQEPSQIVLSSLRHPQEEQSDIEFILNTLGRLWLEGKLIDWSKFYANEKRHRLPLPTYPFERQRYWIEPKKLSEAETNRSVSLSKKPDIADWFYIPSWKRSIAPLFQPGELESVKRCWLMFVDECGLGEQIAQLLAQEKQTVIKVMIGEEFRKVDDGVYIINPRSRQDYDSLLKELCTLKKIPQIVTHLWSIQPHQQKQSKIEFFESSQELGFYSLLYFVQAFKDRNLTDSLQIQVVSANMQGVTEEEVLSPEKATLLGPCKVIPQEYTNITCRSIDIVLPEIKTSQENKLVKQLIAEFTAAQSDLVVAYRGNHRWVQIFEPIRLDDTGSKTRLRQDGVYLITGGLGGLGLVLAEHLAKTVQAKLILVGRSPFPKKDEWKKWLETHHSQDEISRKIQKLQALEKLGAEVLVKNADVGDRSQMQAVITQTYEQFGLLHGVIHAAGIVREKSFRSIQETDKTECEQQFQAKGRGLIVLEQELQGRELDFCLLVSSVSSVLGGLGCIAYSAANIFVDAFAYKCNQTHSFPWLNVNWDNWRFKEEKPTTIGLGAGMVELTMTLAEGVEVLQRILAINAPAQIVISTGDLKARIDQWINFKPLQEVKDSQELNSSSSHPRPSLSNSYIAPRNEVEETVTEIWEKLLGIRKIGIYDNFFELGGDSLLALPLVSRLRDTFQVELPLRTLFKATNIADLSQVIITNEPKPGQTEKVAKALKRLKNMSAQDIKQTLQEKKRGARV